VVSSIAEPARARSCIAGALADGPWTIPLEALATIDPVALSAFADELTALGLIRVPDNGLLSGASAKEDPGRSGDLIRT
jgi:hypothetical protein